MVPLNKLVYFIVSESGLRVFFTQDPQRQEDVKQTVMVSVTMQSISSMQSLQFLHLVYLGEMWNLDPFVTYFMNILSSGSLLHTYRTSSVVYKVCNMI